MSQPLAGVCVLDFSTLLPGPLEQKFWENFCAALGYPALGADNELIEHGGAA